MKRSLFFVALALVAMIIAGPPAFGPEVMLGIPLVCMAIGAWLTMPKFEIVGKPAMDAINLLRMPQRALIVAYEFLRREVRRARPRIESRWRMCPSG